MLVESEGGKGGGGGKAKKGKNRLNVAKYSGRKVEDVQLRPTIMERVKETRQ